MPKLPWLVLGASLFQRLSAQATNATCDPSFNWMSNSLGQSPCLVAAYAMGACQANGYWFVSALQNQLEPYRGPSFEQADICTCNSVSYSLISACGFCQNGQIPLWDTWVASCPNADIFNPEYPHSIPAGTAIPAWTYPQVVGEWDIVAAMLIAAEGEPDSTVGGAPASTVAGSPAGSSGIGFYTPTPIYASTTAVNNPFTPLSNPPSNTHATSHSLLGIIVGAACGGSALLAVAAAATYIVLRRRQTTYKTTPTVPADTTYTGEEHKYSAVAYAASVPYTMPEPSVAAVSEQQYYYAPPPEAVYEPMMMHTPSTEYTMTHTEAAAVMTPHGEALVITEATVVAQDINVAPPMYYPPGSESTYALRHSIPNNGAY